MASHRTRMTDRPIKILPCGAHLTYVKQFGTIDFMRRNQTRAQYRKYDRKYRASHLVGIHKKDRIRDKIRKERIRDPYKLRTRRILNHAVRSGKILKPGVCQECGWEGRIEGHHADYSKPFEVLWLCRICHGKKHRLSD